MSRYFKRLYERTMRESYSFAEARIVAALADGGNGLDCGAGDGHMAERLIIPADRYHGIEWSAEATLARDRGLNVVNGDLNQQLPYADEHFKCVFGLSVLEHLLRPCRYLRECHRVLEPGGTLVILTPNIATYFTAFLILAGRMPSSGPHPDSDALIASTRPVEELMASRGVHDADNDTPSHRHLVIFSYLALRRYLQMLGFRDVVGKGFGVYPFPNAVQPLVERLDPYHAHQMVFVARK
jgi:SAM-dependent methyltransferase